MTVAINEVAIPLPRGSIAKFSGLSFANSIGILQPDLLNSLQLAICSSLPKESSTALEFGYTDALLRGWIGKRTKLGAATESAVQKWREDLTIANSTGVYKR